MLLAVDSFERCIVGYHFTSSNTNGQIHTSDFSAVPSKTHTPASRLQHRGLRFYNPQLGRWMSRDPIEERDVPNLYMFGRNDPVNNFDPYGMETKCCGNKTYDPMSQGCCCREIYQLATHCCEDQKVVKKKPIWIYKRPIGSNKTMPGAIYHSFVCCDGPLNRCYGMQVGIGKDESVPKEDSSLFPKAKLLQEYLVCPKHYKSKCANPPSSPHAYTGIYNCQSWAEEPDSTDNPVSCPCQ